MICIAADHKKKPLFLAEVFFTADRHCNLQKQKPALLTAHFQGFQ